MAIGLAAAFLASNAIGTALGQQNGTHDLDRQARLERIRRYAEQGEREKKAIPVLINLFPTESDPDLRIAILEALMAISPTDPAVCRLLTEAFADKVPRVSIEAVCQVIRTGPNGVRALATAILSGNEKVRRGASLAFVCFEGEIDDALPSLRKALGDSDEQVRVNATHAISKLGRKAESALPDLIKLLRDPAAGTNAVFALGRIGKQAVPHLIRTIQDPDPSVRKRSAFALEQIGPDAEAAIPALERALLDTDADVRSWAKDALEVIRVKNTSK
jgi:HEAT repeat protein